MTAVMEGGAKVAVGRGVRVTTGVGVGEETTGVCVKVKEGVWGIGLGVAGWQAVTSNIIAPINPKTMDKRPEFVTSGL